MPGGRKFASKDLAPRQRRKMTETEIENSKSKKNERIHQLQHQSKVNFLQMFARGKRQGLDDEGEKDLNSGASSSEDEMIGESHLDREENMHKGSNNNVLELDGTIDEIGGDDDYESSGESEC